MSMITVAEAAENWGISVQLVRRYCREKRIPEAVMYDGIWFNRTMPLARIVRNLSLQLCRRFSEGCIGSAVPDMQICTIICKLICLTAQIACPATV